MKAAFIIAALFLAFPLAAEPLIRLDSPGVELYDDQKFLVALLISRNCALCDRQLTILKDCIDGKRVSVFIEGDNEERLRQIVRRKNITFPTYRASSSLKKKLSFGERTPALRIKGKEKVHVKEGFTECKEITKLIQSR